MTIAAFIGCDWGTTRARFWLCDSDGVVLETREAPGVAQLGSAVAVESTFHATVSGWDGAIPAIFCGMAGSTIGWRDAGYHDCPCPLEVIGGQALRFESSGRSIAILPGLRARNSFGLPDVMRGEETQIAGAAVLSDSRSFIAVLPGTHNKWARVEGGVVTGFHTVLTGELFEAVARHSVLLGGDPGTVTPGSAFDAGIEAVRQNPDAGAESLIFSVRARQIAGELAKQDAASYLSGLLIGADVRSAFATLRLDQTELPIHIICSEHLAALYTRALTAFGLTATNLSGADTVRAGLHAAYNAQV